jgi:hypothetical protein
MGVSKSRWLGLSRLWNPIALRIDLVSRCGLKQSCSSCWELSNGMLHALYSQVNWVDSLLFLVESQIGSLIPSRSFDHNLCFRYPNEQCEPILDIYVPIAFQWYKECHKPLNFDPWNYSLKFWEISQSGSCLGNVKVHSLILSHTFLHSQEYVMWLSGFFLARTFATSLPWLPGFFLARNLITLLLWLQPKTKVVTLHMSINVLTWYLKEHLLKTRQTPAHVGNLPKKPTTRGKIEPLNF